MTRHMLDALILALAQATGPSRELDMLIGKHIGEIPLDAEWGGGSAEDDDLSKKFADFRRQHGEEWTTPAHLAHRGAFRAFLATRPTAEEVKAWVDAHPIDTSMRPFWCGRIRRYSQSIDAALSLVPAEFAWSVQWSAGCEAEAWLYPPDNFRDIDFRGNSATAPLALCIASLKARRPA